MQPYLKKKYLAERENMKILVVLILFDKTQRNKIQKGVKIPTLCISGDIISL